METLTLWKSVQSETVSDSGNNSMCVGKSSQLGKHDFSDHVIILKTSCIDTNFASQIIASFFGQLGILT